MYFVKSGHILLLKRSVTPSEQAPTVLLSGTSAGAVNFVKGATSKFISRSRFGSVIPPALPNAGGQAGARTAAALAAAAAKRVSQPTVQAEVVDAGTPKSPLRRLTAMLARHASSKSSGSSSSVDTVRC